MIISQRIARNNFLTRCRIRDAGCLGCGNVVGYHVTHPCDRCLDSCNNGQYFILISFWMFLSDAARPVDRLEKSGSKILRWSAIADDESSEENPRLETLGALCR